MRERLERSGGPRQQRAALLLTVAGWLFLASICAVQYAGGRGGRQEAPTCPPCIQQQCAAAVAVAAGAAEEARPPAQQQVTQQQHQQPQQPQQPRQQAAQQQQPQQLQLPADWRAVDALITAPSPLHGQQQKGGLPDRWGSLLEHMTNRDAERHGMPAVMSPAVFQWFARAHT